MSIIYHNSEITNWYELLFAAQSQANISLDQEVEAYLAFMMKQSVADISIVNSIVALNYLEALNQSQTRKIKLLKKTAECSLILSTLFPKIAKKRNLSLSYYAEMSQVAYSDLAILCDYKMPNIRDLFKKVLDSFNDILSVLISFRAIGKTDANNSLESRFLKYSANHQDGSKSLMN